MPTAQRYKKSFYCFRNVERDCVSTPPRRVSVSRSIFTRSSFMVHIGFSMFYFFLTGRAPRVSAGRPPGKALPEFVVT